MSILLQLVDSVIQELVQLYEKLVLTSLQYILQSFHELSDERQRKRCILSYLVLVLHELRLQLVHADSLQVLPCSPQILQCLDVVQLFVVL